MADNTAQYLEVYSKAVNQIDDVLEYRYKNMELEELAGYIRTIIANITPKLKRIQGGLPT